MHERGRENRERKQDKKREKDSAGRARGIAQRNKLEREGRR